MIKMKKRGFVMLIITVVVVTVMACFVGLFLYTGSSDLTLVNTQDYQQMKTIAEKYSKLYSMQTAINDEYLWKVSDETEMNGIYKGLVNSLGDKYSEYMTPAEVKTWKEEVTGTFTGIGVTFSEDKKGNFVIMSVLDDSPAKSAGLKAGDIITKVNGKSYESSEAVKSAMRGNAGTTVKVTILRNGKSKVYRMVRAEVDATSVYSAVLKGNIGYIRITAFEEDTANQFKKELTAMENKNVKGMIIDLRFNGGGIMDEGIKIADMLLPECKITYMKDNAGKTTTYNSDGDCTKLKYVVLVNQYTASTSEILAAAIKDNHGGKLVGMTTFGKGIVQQTTTLNDGSVLKLTVMQYFSPDGHVIHKKGITPDYKVDLTSKDTTDKQLEKAMKLFK
jgi:C-terminal peptidase (prc)